MTACVCPQQAFEEIGFARDHGAEGGVQRDRRCIAARDDVVERQARALEAYGTWRSGAVNTLHAGVRG